MFNFTKNQIKSNIGIIVKKSLIIIETPSGISVT